MLDEKATNKNKEKKTKQNNQFPCRQWWELASLSTRSTYRPTYSSTVISGATWLFDGVRAKGWHCSIKVRDPAKKKLVARLLAWFVCVCICVYMCVCVYYVTMTIQPSSQHVFYFRYRSRMGLRWHSQPTPRCCLRVQPAECWQAYPVLRPLLRGSHRWVNGVPEATDFGGGLRCLHPRYRYTYNRVRDKSGWGSHWLTEWTNEWHR